MELHALTAFVAVARHGSFSLAAEELFLTQPAISKRIHALESELEGRLFNRIGRRVQLTEKGELLLPRAQDLLQRASDIKRVLNEFGDQVAGRLQMGTSHHIGLHRLPPVLRAFTGAYPSVALDLRFMDSEAACHSVQTGDLELAVVTLPPGDPPQGLILEPIWHDPLCIVASIEHPLAALEKPGLADLGQHPAVLPSPSTYTRGILERAMHEHGQALSVNLSTNYLETLRMLVSIGLGWSLLPAGMLDDPQLKRIEIPDLSLHRTLGIVRHRERSLSNAASAMRAHCEAFADREED